MNTYTVVVLGGDQRGITVRRGHARDRRGVQHGVLASAAARKLTYPGGRSGPLQPLARRAPLATYKSAVHSGRLPNGRLRL